MPLSALSTPCLFQWQQQLTSGHLKSTRPQHRRGHEMEEELRCPICKVFFINPVLLPCSHSLCLSCANGIQVHKPSSYSNSLHTVAPSPDSGSISSGDTGSVFTNSELESDQLSVVSDNDSGVLSSNSRPASFIGSATQVHSPGTQSGSAYFLTCPVCQKLCHLGDQGSQGLFRNRALANVILRYCSKQAGRCTSPALLSSSSTNAKCQLCDNAQPEAASVHCDQCDVSYCDSCLKKCHPSRGPLAKHQLKPVVPDGCSTTLASKNDGYRCRDHSSQMPTHFCFHCRWPLCSECVSAEDNVHPGHDIQPLAVVCKMQKAELSQTLQSLSEKAKTATEDIAHLKQLNDKVQSNSADIGKLIVAQCDQLIEAVQRRKEALLNMAMKEKDNKNCLLREQITGCTNLLQKTNGLVQFSIEALKESDPVSFVLISLALIHRAANMETVWEKQLAVESTSPVSAEFDLILDTSAVMKSIEQLDFIRMTKPGVAVIVPEKCSAENNSATIAWRPPENSFVEGYILEIDGGNGDNRFKEVYAGPDTVCLVENLNFGCIYQARVKAYNSVCEGDYCRPVRLQTADAAWFQLDPESAPPDVLVGEDNTLLTSKTFDYRVVLGTVGFRAGRHYWEVILDKRDANADLVVGVATKNVARNLMLGKDDHGWSMYIDEQRSWYLHAETHHSRVEKGVYPGCAVGVLLDCDQGTLSFSVNGRKQTSQCAFKNLPRGVLYPAFAVNRNLQITLHSGIHIPRLESTDSSSGED